MNQKITAKKLVISIAVLVAVFVFGSCSEQQPEPQDNQQGNNQNQNQENQTEEDLVWYEIPELGIKFKVAQKAKEELKYVYEKQGKYGRAVFYYQGLYEIDNQCNGYNNGVAALAKIEGIAGESDNIFIVGSIEGGNVKQMGGYFLIHGGPGAPCISDKGKRQNFFDKHPELGSEIFGSYLDTIEEL